MASIATLPSRYWRAQVRRKGNYANRSFRLKSDTQIWARETEGAFEQVRGRTRKNDRKAWLREYLNRRTANASEFGKDVSDGTSLRACVRVDDLMHLSKLTLDELDANQVLEKTRPLLGLRRER